MNLNKTYRWINKQTDRQTDRQQKFLAIRLKASAIGYALSSTTLTHKKIYEEFSAAAEDLCYHSSFHE
jgi:hypothetical protein